MNPSPVAILLIIAIGAAVFGGIVFLGLKSGTAPVGLSPVVTGTTVRVPDILNLPGFGSAQKQPPTRTQPSGGASGPDTVVERSELPFPTLPGAPASRQPPKFSTPIQIVPSRQTQPRSLPVPRPVHIPETQPIPQLPPPPRQSSQTATIGSFSIFNASPQLRDFRTQMVKEGAIQSTDFVRINNNKDMEVFLLKLVEWQARKAGSTDAQIQDALDRIRKAYDQVKR